MASIVEKHLRDGSWAHLVEYRTADGQQRSRQFGGLVWRWHELADRRLSRALCELLAVVPAVDPSLCPNAVHDGCC